MRKLAGIVIGVTVVVLATKANAACAPDPADSTRDCFGCGNLQANPVRGIDHGWNGSIADRRLANKLRYEGQGTVNLIDPPAASDGVTYFRANIVDTGFIIVNSVTHNRLVTLAAGLNGAEPTGQLSVTIGNLEVESIQRNPSAPFRVELSDQNGNVFHTEDISKGTGTLDRANFSPTERNQDERYRQSECITQDSSNDDDSNNDSGGHDGGGDSGSGSGGVGTGGGSGGGGGGGSGGGGCTVSHTEDETTVTCQAL